MTRLHAAPLAACALILCGCAASHAHLSDDFGKSLALDTRAQISYPDARYPAGPARMAAGSRAALAMDRYVTGKVLIPYIAASKVGTAGNGAPSGQ